MNIDAYIDHRLER